MLKRMRCIGLRPPARSVHCAQALTVAMQTASAGPSVNSAQKFTTCESESVEWLRPSGSSILAADVPIASASSASEQHRLVEPQVRGGRDHTGGTEEHHRGDVRPRRRGQPGEGRQVRLQRTHITLASRRGPSARRDAAPARSRSEACRSSSTIRKNASAISGSYIVPRRSMNHRDRTVVRKRPAVRPV